MFKVNNKDTRTTELALSWYLNYLLWIYFTPCSLFDFEQVDVDFVKFSIFGNVFHRKQTS